MLGVSVAQWYNCRTATQRSWIRSPDMAPGFSVFRLVRGDCHRAVLQRPLSKVQANNFLQVYPRPASTEK